jgi:NAD(P)-dependent dehydrogenase (short-subunit alcohol dehydrogenase family)
MRDDDRHLSFDEKLIESNYNSSFDSDNRLNLIIDSNHSIFMHLTLSAAMAAVVKTALVSGANRGIGREVARVLAAQCQSLDNANASTLNANAADASGFRVLCGARDASLCAVDSRTSAATAESGLMSEVGSTFVHVDYNDASSLRNTAAWIGNSGGDNGNSNNGNGNNGGGGSSNNNNNGLDVVVANAGVANLASPSLTIDVANELLKTNFFGTLSFLEHMLPHINDGGRVVIVSSVVGSANAVVCPVRRAAFTAPDVTVADVSRLVSEYLDDLRDGGIETTAKAQMGHVTVSKLALNALTGALSRSPSLVARDVRVNAWCPGFVRTRSVVRVLF